jgi:TolB-like protein
MRNRIIRHLALLLSFACTSLSSVFAAVGPRPQYSLAVLPLEASGRITADEANILTERLAMELGKAGVFIVTPQSTVAATLSNGGAGCSTVECGAQAGRQLSTQLVVNGSVRKVGQLYFVETQMIHTNSGQVVQRANEDFDGDFVRLQNLMAIIARKLVGKTSSPSSEAAAESSQLGATENSGADMPADSGDTSSGATEYRSGGNKFLIYGLVAVGAVGAAVGITQLTKGSNNNKNDNPPTTQPDKPLGDPPTFP